ncbi:MAG: hypothetical protein ACLFWH_12200 [Actinomycetota bacterium]
MVGLSYVIATGLGVVMRLDLLGWRTGVPFDHTLHAHSHTLYFGWAGLGVLIMATRALGTHRAALSRTMIFLALSTPAIFVGFLALGYHPVTIAMSTVVMLAWYLATWLWWREAREAKGVGFSFLRTAFAYLVASSFGVWVLGVLQATGAGTPLSETLAIHGFLLGFAWFLVLGMIGLMTLNSDRLGLALDDRVVRRALSWWMPLAILTFPLGVVDGPEVTWLGPAGRLAGLVLLYPTWLWVRALWQAAPFGPSGRSWRMVSVWFAMAATATAAVSIAGTPALSWAGRQGVVFYLHVLLVGFVSTSLVAVLTERPPIHLFDVHHLTLGVMVAGLAMASAGLFVAGMWVAAVGGAALWVVGVGLTSLVVAKPAILGRKLETRRPS